MADRHPAFQVQRRMLTLDKEQARSLHCQGISDLEIARRLGCAIESVRRALDRVSTKTRSVATAFVPQIPALTIDGTADQARERIGSFSRRLHLYRNHDAWPEARYEVVDGDGRIWLRTPQEPSTRAVDLVRERQTLESDG